MWRVFIIHVSVKAFADASDKTWVIGNTPRFFLKFSREILLSKQEYTVDGMETDATEEDREGEGFDFRLDPNRIRTDAEIQLFADVFKISFDEARRIVTGAGKLCQS